MYKTINLNGTEADHRVKFSTIVWLFDRHLDGVPVMPTYEYGARFEAVGQKYERRVSISHEIKPRDTDRFTIKIGVDKSSLHRLTLGLLYNNNVISNEKIDIKIFVPRSGAKYI